jgi:hypothetical protein
MAFAVSVNGVPCYLTVKGQLVWESHAWNGFLPRVDELVRVTGRVDERLDVHGEEYCTIEVETVSPM